MPELSFEELYEFDPKHVGFSMARYKFVAKMFAGYNRVMEVGCGNGMYQKIVKQTVKSVKGFDIPDFDITQDYVPGCDGVYMLDVFEHIKPELESAMLENLSCCAPVCIIGTPSLESQKYASTLSLAKHVNCKTGEDLRASCKKHWKNVFMFGMNDETLHTGFLPMSHYLIALCTE